MENLETSLPVADRGNDAPRMPLSELTELIGASVAESIELKQQLVAIYDNIANAGRILADAFLAGNKAIFFGNGGSAADAQHLASEFVGRFLAERRPLPALALHTNTSSVTAIVNDYGGDELFRRQLWAFAKPGDVAVAISTSGTSVNVVRAAKEREALGISLIALTGNNGEALRPYADEVIAVPSKRPPRIQETHILIGHILCEWVERRIVQHDR